MRLLIDPADHFKFMNECVESSPNKVHIASYGIWAGIMPDGRDTRDWNQKKYFSETRELLESLRSTAEVQLLIGLYEFKSCKGKQPCSDCEHKYMLDLFRLMNHVDKFPEFRWKVSSESHVKCCLFHYEDGTQRGVAGGRNLTDSSWADVSVELDKMSVLRLEGHFSDIWKTGCVPNAKWLDAIVKAQGISESTVKRIAESYS